MIARILALSLIASLASCGGVGSASVGSLNPFTWFGSTSSSSSEPVPVPARQVRDDGRATVARILTARLDYTPQGIIVRADAQVPSQGFHSARLRPVNFGVPSEFGDLAFDFRAVAPEGVSSSTGSSLNAGTFVSSSRLVAVRSVTVRGSENAVTIRVR